MIVWLPEIMTLLQSIMTLLQEFQDITAKEIPFALPFALILHLAQSFRTWQHVG